MIRFEVLNHNLHHESVTVFPIIFYIMTEGEVNLKTHSLPTKEKERDKDAAISRVDMLDMD